MISSDIVYTHELAVHDADIENLNATAFGPARFTRAAHFVRRGGPHDLSLSFVAVSGRVLIGSIRMTPIAIGLTRALLLGPIVVSSNYKNAGVGSKLMIMALEAARNAGHGLVILVGDEPYYRRFGFVRADATKIIMPAPVNPARLLAYPLREHTLEAASGLVRHAACLR